MPQKYMGQANLVLSNLEAYNGVHMTDKEKFVYGFKLSALKGISISKLMRRFRSERALRQNTKDFLENDCQPIVDGDRQMILTGCDTSASILKRLTRVKPQFVAYPGGVHRAIDLIFGNMFSKGGFSLQNFQLPI